MEMEKESDNKKKKEKEGKSQWARKGIISEVPNSICSHIKLWSINYALSLSACRQRL